MQSGMMYSAPQKSIQDNEAEFNALSCEEMERVHKDVYGFGTYDIVENDDLIKKSLEEFEQEVSKIISTEKCKWYLLGLQVNPSYVNSSDLRLRFLRREFFDAKKAAMRYINYWKDKVFVWGEEKAFRQIKISDFEEEDQSVLRQGSQQVLKERDIFGRVIFVIDKSRADNRLTHRMSTIRLIWYQVECSTENVDDQKNGVVAVMGVSLAPPSIKYENRKLESMIVRMVNESLPHRVVAIHSLTTSRIEKYVVPFLLFMLRSDMCYRFKLHSNPKTIFSELEQYGIYRSVLPQDIGGTSIYIHEDWLEERRSQDI